MKYLYGYSFKEVTTKTIFPEYVKQWVVFDPKLNTFFYIINLWNQSLRGVPWNRCSQKVRKILKNRCEEVRFLIKLQL